MMKRSTLFNLLLGLGLVLVLGLVSSSNGASAQGTTVKGTSTVQGLLAQRLLIKAG